ncbi:MAG: NAD(P)-dependent oxidoreductase [Actinomycetales bacterium]|nr:NAD(P)-dependent oxidoreductase [Actinomycetales bacterium]
MPDRPGRISLVGLGNMGSPMAARWIEAGVEVHGFDTSPAALEQLTSAGGVAAASPAAAAAAATIHVLMLPNSRIVDAVLDDLLASDALQKGSIVVDMSSSEPTRSIANAERLAERGVGFVDAPVSGGVRGVLAGNLAILVGGTAPAIDTVLPLLEVLGTPRHVGDVGAGHAAKALNNLVSAAHLWATSEAVLVAERFGIPRETMVEVLNASTGRSVSSEVKWPKFILTGDYGSGFQAGLLSKDANVAVGLGEQLGVPSLLGPAVAELWQRAASELPPGSDHTEVARWLESAFAEAPPRTGEPRP